MQILIPVSPGELIDKITILEIKLSEITDAVKLQNVQDELHLLNEVLEVKIVASDTLQALHDELRAINKKIWDTENDVREFWNDDVKFLEAARGSHYQNDERARVKRAINTLLGSTIIEEKSHPKYEHKT
jgi:hypothetical protein